MGIEMTSNGIERIYGPIEQTEHVRHKAMKQPILPDHNHVTPRRESDTVNHYVYGVQEGGNDQTDQPEDRLFYSLNRREGTEQSFFPELQDAPVNQLADKTAGLLQRISQASIQTVVGLFNGLF